MHHYRLTADQSEISEAASVSSANTQPYLPSGDFFPLSLVPVVRLNHNGQRELVAMEWGLLPYWWKLSAKQTSRRTFQQKCFNARCETVRDKPAFRDAFKYRRCLIPATEFFEKGHYFYLDRHETFMFAGLWERWEDESETVDSCTVITTTPNNIVRSVGHHRQPVILPYEAWYAEWLSHDTTDTESLFWPLADCCLNRYRAEGVENE